MFIHFLPLNSQLSTLNFLRENEWNQRGASVPALGELGGGDDGVTAEDAGFGEVENGLRGADLLWVGRGKRRG